jgi:lipid-binding SYLF domain-containing protein
LIALVFAFGTSSGWADEKDEKAYADTIAKFKANEGVAPYFDSAYGYGIWPTIAKGGLGIGASTGKGRIYRQGNVVGTSRVSDVSIGLQAGGQAYSQVVFFEDERAFTDFTSGNFEFSAQASAVAITASAQAATSTEGNRATSGAGGPGAAAAGGYTKGMQVFTLAKGGLMYEAAIAGQKYSYKPVD